MPGQRFIARGVAFGLLAASCGGSTERISDDAGQADANPVSSSGGGAIPDAVPADGPAVADGPTGDAGPDGDATSPPPIDCGAGAGTQAGSPWPMFGRCPSHDKRSPFRVPSTTLRWAFSFPTAGQGGNVALSSPSIAADGTLYVGSQVGVFYAVSPAGAQKWSYATGAPISASPAIGADGTVFVGSNDKSLYAFRPDGSILWTLPTGGAVTSPALGPDGTVYAVSQDGILHAVDPSTGAAKWTFTGIGPTEDPSPAVGADGTVLVPFADGVLHAVGPDGTERWAFTNSTSILTPATVGADQSVYFGGGSLVAVSPTHLELWSQPDADSVSGMPALGADGSVYFTSGDGTLYAAAATGASLWTYSTMYQLEEATVDGAGRLYFGSRGAGVFVVDSNGAQVSTPLLPGGDVRSTPVVGADGTLYVASGDGTLSAFGP
jgi:outer membrane protein assembly factor BamB